MVSTLPSAREILRNESSAKEISISKHETFAVKALIEGIMAANETTSEVDTLKQQEIRNQNKYNEDQINRNALDNSDNAEERIRVDRRKLELLLQAGLKDGQDIAEGGEEFFQKIQAATKTVISWPSRLKIGAKSKKDWLLQTSQEMLFPEHALPIPDINGNHILGYQQYANYLGAMQSMFGKCGGMPPGPGFLGPATFGGPRLHRPDPHIKVAGLPVDIKKARQMILSVLDTKTSRVTLKMDVSFTDHSHIIGRGGNCIKRVMQETGCHIHFPDSNRTSSEKSNQVSIAGPPHGVEAARKQIRELLPIVLMFEIPQNTVVVPDSTSPTIHSIAQKYNVTITFKQRPRAYGFIGTVRGLHSDPIAVRDAVLSVLEHLTGNIPVTVLVTTQIEIDCKHHTFIIGRNGSNIKHIMQSTGASLQFPDQNGVQGKKTTVFITGPIESTITAKVQLMEFLPLVLMFDVKEEEDEFVSDPRMINKLIEDLDVLINVKSKPRQGTKSVIVKGIEKNAHNMYLTRSHLVREDPNLVPLISPPLPTPPMPVPNPYFCQPRIGIPMPGNEFPTALLNAGMNGKFIPNSINAGIGEKASSSPLQSPLPSESSSPLPFHQTTPSKHQANNPLGNYEITGNMQKSNTQDVHPVSAIPTSLNDKLVSSDLVRTLSVDSLFKQDGSHSGVDGIKGSNSTGHITSSMHNEGMMRSGNRDELSMLRKNSTGSFPDSLSMRRHPNDEKLPMPVGSRLSPTNGQDSSYPMGLNGSWNMQRRTIAMLEGVRNSPFPGSDSMSPEQALSDSQSELSMSGSLSQTSNLIDRLPFRKKKFNIADYELKRQMASKAITNETDYEEVRMPTGTWSGFGFSKSMPESALKDLVSNPWVKNSRSQMSKYSLVDNFQQSPSQSLNSSASSNVSNNSNASNASSSSSSSFSGPESPSRRKPNSGPPPGLEGKPVLENAALLLNNNIDFNCVLANDSSLGTLAAVTDLCDLFSRLGLGKYADVFQDQEVDLNTFMTLTDDDLKELGVSTFGARRRMILAIQDLKKIHGQRDMTSPSSTTQTSIQTSVSQRCMPLDLASSSLRW